MLPKYQKIRYGFPPHVLHPPEEGKEQEPIPVQHGERVIVEVLPPPEPEPQLNENKDIQEENKMDVAGAMGGEVKSSVQETSKENKTDQSPMDGKIIIVVVFIVFLPLFACVFNRLLACLRSLLILSLKL